jgi:hypothetical protein
MLGEGKNQETTETMRHGVKELFHFLLQWILRVANLGALSFVLKSHR